MNDIGKITESLRGMSLTHDQARHLKVVIDCRVGAPFAPGEFASIDPIALIMEREASNAR